MSVYHASPSKDRPAPVACSPCADLERRFVVLPEPYDTRAWVVDLRDPYHPIARRYETWTAAETARLEQLQQALLETDTPLSCGL